MKPKSYTKNTCFHFYDCRADQVGLGRFYGFLWTVTKVVGTKSILSFLDSIRVSRQSNTRSKYSRPDKHRHLDIFSPDNG